MSSSVSTRLVRLLNMVPYLRANPRITRAEAAAELGVTETQLTMDLDQLWMCGLPGYGPGDLIDFEFSGDTIDVTFSAGMDHPRLRARAPFDLILANILAGPLIELAADIADALAPGGRLILAGLLQGQAEAVAAAYRRRGLMLTGRIEQGDWPTLVLRKRKALGWR